MEDNTWTKVTDLNTSDILTRLKAALDDKNHLTIRVHRTWGSMSAFFLRNILASAGANVLRGEVVESGDICRITYTKTWQSRFSLDTQIYFSGKEETVGLRLSPVTDDLVLITAEKIIVQNNAVCGPNKILTVCTW